MSECYVEKYEWKKKLRSFLPDINEHLNEWQIKTFECSSSDCKYCVCYRCDWCTENIGESEKISPRRGRVLLLSMLTRVKVTLNSGFHQHE